MIVTALVLEDDAPAHKMRGVKLEISSSGLNDRIYLDQEAMQRTRDALEEIAGAVAARGAPGRNGCMGAKEFWAGYKWTWNKYHELNASYCGGEQGLALVLSGRGKAGSYPFAGKTPVDLSGVLALASKKLNER